jgi:beta-phosphoglucomutase-like phosphatase (HAD superfamily)/dTDP-glucose pyrophosphorylase
MTKLIIFDLDGVLVDAKQIHFETLNQALWEIAQSNKYVISEAEHLSTYDGLKTNQKLELLTQNKGLHTNTYETVWNRKQELTIDTISKLKQNTQLIVMFDMLRKDGYKLACASNSIRRSVLVMLSKIGVIEHMDLILSNEDVKNSKPHPEMYWKAMSMMSVLPEETLIVEDSPHGLLAASRSRANVLRVDNPNDLVYGKIINKIKENKGMSIPKWQGGKLNVLIPMAGAGSRFQQAGYTFPKPLIEVNGKPMIQVVVDNLNVDANFIFVVQKEHREKYNLDTLLNLITPNCKIVEVDGLTEGAACTTLLAKEYIDNDAPLLMANSDQFLEWDSNEFMYKMIEQRVDGGIVTFTSTHPKWSFAKVNEIGDVVEVAEKKPISNIATVGVYYWSKGSDYVKYTEQMIEKNIRVNGEFYVCPVFNEAIGDDKIIRTFNIDKMWGIGTPEDLNYYLENY